MTDNIVRPPIKKKFAKRRTDPLESAIERKVCEYGLHLGIEHRKFKTPNRHSAPDQMFLFGKGLVAFIEFKRLGEKCTPGQEREQARLRDMGYEVAVVDTIGDGKDLLDEWAMMFLKVRRGG